ncbi:MAG: type 4a pilus biogenesis protein PilO [Candidatus Omnitrophica bacterium]|nr:type 4a pilus biogenesis protein PilO [Candidatus Omnitrophota bacterium]MBU4478515.1 type 4a pilus biogenesis protein PilO [Candidatus Omnitrophota bacterium]MCG2703696.1 type 4a pilus biogenesis protein PilO [Candidatus Omnitrophota bacterium]
MNIDIPILKNSKISLQQLLLGIGLIVCLLLTGSQVIHVVKISKELSEKKKVLQELDAGMKNFAALEQEFAFLDKNFKDFINRLPSQKEFPVFLELISRMAKENNVKIIAIEPQKVINNPGLFFVRILIFIDAFCGYHDFGKFINALESSEKLMKVETMTINADEDGGGQHQVFLALNVFCFKEGILNEAVTQ